ncbi:unnamed protein product, partial [Prorocentrum cordatum]
RRAGLMSGGRGMGPGPAATLAAPLLVAWAAPAAAAADLQWRGLLAEGARAAGGAAVRPQDLLCGAGVAAIVAVSLHFFPRCCVGRRASGWG